MLSARDTKLVERYYLLPKAAWYSLAALFLTGGLAILLVMIDNIGLGSSGFGDAQAFAMIALMAIEGATCIACGVAARRGLGSEHWQELERRAMGKNANIDANPALAGGVGTAAARAGTAAPGPDALLHPALHGLRREGNGIPRGIGARHPGL